MENFKISTAELLNVLAAMIVAADAYTAEANRTSLADVRRTLTRRAETTRIMASNLRNRALSDLDFARKYRKTVT